MRSVITLAAACAVAVALSGCGGGSSSTSATTPTSPSTPGAETVHIVGISGNTAFSPDVVQASVGDMVTWKNDTSVLHHIVLDNGTVIGDIQPGASSAPLRLTGLGNDFFCTIHSTMIGSIGGSTPPEPPPCTTPGYC
jgi:plastocyanin